MIVATNSAKRSHKGQVQKLRAALVAVSEAAVAEVRAGTFEVWSRPLGGLQGGKRSWAFLCFVQEFLQHGLGRLGGFVARAPIDQDRRSTHRIEKLPVVTLLGKDQSPIQRFGQRLIALLLARAQFFDLASDRCDPRLQLPPPTRVAHRHQGRHRRRPLPRARKTMSVPTRWAEVRQTGRHEHRRDWFADRRRSCPRNRGSSVHRSPRASAPSASSLQPAGCASPTTLARLRRAPRPTPKLRVRRSPRLQ